MLLTMALLLAAGCGSVRPDFIKAREAALAEPGPPPSSWRPDLEIHLSRALLEEALTEALGAKPFKGSFRAGAAQVQPSVRVINIAVHKPLGCDDCLSMNADLKGRLSYEFGPLSGRKDLEGSFTADAAVASTPVDDGFELVAHVRRIRDVELSVGRMKGAPNLPTELERWVVREMDDLLPPIALGVIGTDKLPVRALRFTPDARTLRLEVLSDAPGGRPVSAPAGRPQEGFRVSVSEATLLGLARAAAFENGEVGYGIVPEPTALDVDGERFTLGLRLWKPSGFGGGWWRDYEVMGTARVDRKGRVRLEAQDAREVGASKGADLADPLVALAEGMVLQRIEDALTRSVPGKKSLAATDVSLSFQLTSVEGRDETVVVTGQASVEGGG